MKYKYVEFSLSTSTSLQYTYYFTTAFRSYKNNLDADLISLKMAKFEGKKTESGNPTTIMTSATQSSAKS